MRFLFLLLLFAAVHAFAQPDPPRITFTLAGDAAEPRPLEREHRVEQHYRERVPYVGMSGSWLKPEVVLPLQGGLLLADTAEPWLAYAPVEGMGESFVLVIADADTLRIDLPEKVDALNQRAQGHWGRDWPQVFRFRKGGSALEKLVNDPWGTQVENELAMRMVEEDEAAYRKQLAEQAAYFGAQPPAATPINTEPLHTVPRDEIEREIAQRPGLKEVNVDSVVAGNVWVRISGRVMLDGGCASGMPLYGVEMRNDTGWVERIPFEVIQMDCGMPWADWTDQHVMIPLASWVRSNSREGEGELEPGTYRFVFMGANMERMTTGPFLVD